MKRPKLLFSILLCLHFAGCSNWHAVQRADLAAFAKQKPLLRIVLTDGSIYETRNYRISADSLVIFASNTEFSGDEKSTIPIDEIITVQKNASDKSILLDIASLVGFFAVIGASQGVSEGP